MEKGPKPFSEEKAKEIMEAEGLEERSQAEQDAFEAGRQAVEKEIQENIENPYGLSYDTRKLVENDHIRIGTPRYKVHDRYRMVSFDDYNGIEVPDKCIIECIEKIDDAEGIFVEFMRRQIVDKDIVIKLLNKGLKTSRQGSILILGLSYQPKLRALIAEMMPELEKNLKGVKIHIGEDTFTMVKEDAINNISKTKSHKQPGR